jgi:hypothetical protein
VRIPSALRLSRHRAVAAWSVVLLWLALLMTLSAVRHRPVAAPAFPNRADTESEATGHEALGAGLGDVGPLGDHR